MTEIPRRVITPLPCAAKCVFERHCGQQLIIGNNGCRGKIMEATGAAFLNPAYGSVQALDAGGGTIAVIEDGEAISSQS